MTRVKLNRTVLVVITFYLACLLLAAYLKLWKEDHKHYILFKDLIPVIFAIPAAYLVFCYQRRNEYLKALRSVYSLLVQANTEFMEYTYYSQQSSEKYTKTKSCISRAIEEVRSVYENIDEVFGMSDGLYPFEPLKEMYHEDLEKLHKGSFSISENNDIRREFYEKWKKVRLNFIVELERNQATFPVTKFYKKKQSLITRIRVWFYKIRFSFFGKIHYEVSSSRNKN